MAGKNIRDFIYLDVEKLYSLSSQTFGGVAEQIISSSEKTSGKSDTKKDSPFSGKSIEQQIAEASSRTETTILYDYLYSKLEDELREAIIEPEAISLANYKDKLGDASLIKIKGVGEIHDYDRLQFFLKEFNALGEAIALSIMSSQEYKEHLTLLEQKVQEAKGKDKEVAREQFRKAKDVKEVAKEKDLTQAEGLLSGLTLFTKVFYPQGYDILVVPPSGEGQIVFRGVVDKKWLRSNPDRLRALYGGDQQADITMVGLITRLPEPEIIVKDQIQALEQIIPQSNIDPGMRDRYKIMFDAMRELEKLFLSVSNRQEVNLYPLAIYRELNIPNIALTETAQNKP